MNRLFFTLALLLLPLFSARASSGLGMPASALPVVSAVAEGVNLLLARIYDPQTGRFLSADPIIHDPSSLQDYNRYTYAGNNPLILIDPTGYDYEYSQDIFGNVSPFDNPFSSYFSLDTTIDANVPSGNSSEISAYEGPTMDTVNAHASAQIDALNNFWSSEGTVGNQLDDSIGPIAQLLDVPQQLIATAPAYIEIAGDYIENTAEVAIDYASDQVDAAVEVVHQASTDIVEEVKSWFD